jgi:hypothetical protein
VTYARCTTGLEEIDIADLLAMTVVAETELDRRRARRPTRGEHRTAVSRRAQGAQSEPRNGER